jgi:hypothetical protein
MRRGSGNRKTCQALLASGTPAGIRLGSNLAAFGALRHDIVLRSNIQHAFYRRGVMHPVGPRPGLFSFL